MSAISVSIAQAVTRVADCAQGPTELARDVLKACP
jgi:hypothetical protein